MKIQVKAVITPWKKGPKEYCDSKCKYFSSFSPESSQFFTAFCDLFQEFLQIEETVSNAGEKVKKMRRCNKCLKSKEVK